MLEHPLSDERFTQGPGQEMLGVLLQVDDVAVIRLDFSVILDTSNLGNAKKLVLEEIAGKKNSLLVYLDIKGFGWMQIRHEIQSDPITDGSHVCGHVS